MIRTIGRIHRRSQSTLKSSSLMHIIHSRYPTSSISSLNNNTLLSSSTIHNTPQSSTLFFSQHRSASSSTKTTTSPLSTTTTTPEPNIEQMYERKTPIEHVLLRPGMYVGPIQRTISPSLYRPEFILAKSSKVQTIKFVRNNNPITYTPALNKIFDEILVNASDNSQRDSSTSKLNVVINRGSTSKSNPSPPFISITNDGKGIPIIIHKKENIYIPEMLFGHLLTGSNFDDTSNRTTGGRHGYGAKLSNIFSKTFTVETVDCERMLRYEQVWKENMSVCGEPKVTNMGGSGGGSGGGDNKDFTRVSFVPDLEKLGFEKSGSKKGAAGYVIDEDNYTAMCRRVVDIAGCNSSLKVTLNGSAVPVSNFKEYAELFYESGSGGGGDNETENAKHSKVIHTKANSRWEVGIRHTSTGAFEQVSFVNSVATTRGGTHVNLITAQIVKRLHDYLTKKHPDLVITAQSIKSSLFIFVNCLIENPSFDSQMKELLTSSPARYGSDCVLSERFFRDIIKSESILPNIIAAAKAKDRSEIIKKLTPSRSKLLNIPKLDDAHNAGSKNANLCTLILTEGDSAKSLAVAGFEIIGRDNYGVFPLRGKFLNVRDVTTKQLTSNAEVTNLCAILGLDFKKSYKDGVGMEGLRYGRVMLMTDQDADGSHIKGLLINFFRHFWPELLKIKPEFVTQFVTPLLKATKGKESVSFYSLPQYDKWRGEFKDQTDANKWKVKYYKGLGTSTAAEGKGYFTDFDKHHRVFSWNGEKDGGALDMIFDKNRPDERKSWLLNQYVENAKAEAKEKEDEQKNELVVSDKVSYEDFVNKEFIHFSNADNARSLPSVVDGLKPSQRKVLYACFKRNLKSEIKVAQLAGYCAEHTAYHHGEVSLHQTIINMAQDYVGSNNVPLLYPSGQFGTRLSGGKDAASPRYIFTKLMPQARALFPEVDDNLLNFKSDDGQQIEPDFYVPVIPLLLLNGCQGIGTGWSSFIPPYNPNEIIDYISARLNKSKVFPKRGVLTPWIKNFTGSIVPSVKGNGFVTSGIVKKKSKSTLEITELPYGKWTGSYKEELLKMREAGAIRAFQEFHTTSKVRFVVTMAPEDLNRAEETGLEKHFKLESNLGTSNMNAVSVSGSITKYECAEDIIDAFFDKRLELYNKRKSQNEKNVLYQLSVCKNKAAFIEMVCDGKIDVIGGTMSKKDVCKKLVGLKFDTKAELEKIKGGGLDLVEIKSVGVDTDDEDDEGSDGAAGGGNNGYDYLLTTNLQAFTTEKIKALGKEKKDLEIELESVRKTTGEQMWSKDLKHLAKVLV